MRNEVFSAIISKQRMSQSSVTVVTTDGEMVRPERTQDEKTQDAGPRKLRSIPKEWFQETQTLASSHT